MLGLYSVYFHDPELVNTMLANYAEVTSADIQRVAQKYLGSAQRTVLLTTPKAQAKTAPPAR
jgi:predicted Zn-dependent peptidase